MDRLTNIEEEFKNVLLEIDTATTLASGYRYLNKVTVVNLEDEGLILDEGDFPAINIYLDPDEKIINGDQQSYRSIVKFKLVCKVAVDQLEVNPRFAINTKMNTLLSDLKAVLSYKYQLNCTCDRADIKRSMRLYNADTNNNLRVGQLVLEVDVLYSQSRLNPLLNACV